MEKGFQIKEEYFQKAGNDPLFWVLNGKQLIFSAELLRVKLADKYLIPFEERIGDIEITTKYNSYFKHSMLLYGYAIENLLKAIYLIDNPSEDLYNEFKFKPPIGFDAHDLKALCEKVNIHCIIEEQELLDELTRTIQWSGRYHLPTNKNKLLDMQEFRVDTIDKFLVKQCRLKNYSKLLSVKI